MLMSASSILWKPRLTGKKISIPISPSIYCSDKIKKKRTYDAIWQNKPAASKNSSEPNFFFYFTNGINAKSRSLQYLSQKTNTRDIYIYIFQVYNFYSSIYNTYNVVISIYTATRTLNFMYNIIPHALCL